MAAQVSAFHYQYDFGDNWEHEIRVEQVLSAVGTVTPRLLAGKRACPPEDCGGSWGYAHLLEVLDDPMDDEHDQMTAWAGDFHPEAFDLDATNAMIDLYERQVRQHRRRRG